MMDPKTEKLARSVLRLLRAANDVLEDAKGVKFGPQHKDAAWMIDGLKFEIDETSSYAEMLVEELGIFTSEALRQAEVA